MTRAYIRTDPDMFLRKAIEQGYPPPAFGAFQAVICLAESQRPRGRFLSIAHLRALLSGPGGSTSSYAKWIPFLIEHGDIVELESGQVYPPGWDEWQEGDWQVAERMNRVRVRRSSEPKATPRTVTKRTPRTVANRTNGTVSKVTAATVTATVTPPSRGGERRAESNERRESPSSESSQRSPNPNPRALDEVLG